jgi:hypothetical protein
MFPPKKNPPWGAVRFARVIPAFYRVSASTGSPEACTTVLRQVKADFTAIEASGTPTFLGIDKLAELDDQAWWPPSDLHI